MSWGLCEFSDIESLNIVIESLNIVSDIESLNSDIGFMKGLTNTRTYASEFIRACSQMWYGMGGVDG